MKNTNPTILNINSLKELQAYIDIPNPLHPLITLIDHSKTGAYNEVKNQKLNMAFYNISIKKSFKGQLKYGKNTYDFDEGSMSFIAPNQIISVDQEEDRNKDGWSLLFHPDLLRSYPLANTIKNYGFFSYESNEALHLSNEEEKIIETIIENINQELLSRLDHFSQDVLVSNIDLLLSYCNRFYNRQFISRKMASSDLLVKFEQLLDNYVSDTSKMQLPTVHKLAQDLQVSSSYLSDMLRCITGQNTQQHIHHKLIEKAKEKLTTTHLTVSEIAYELGFEYSQSFSKLFKSKTNQTPLEYRKSFN